MCLPTAFYFTDDRLGANPLEMARQLPRGCGVVFRHYNTENRLKLASKLSVLCKKYGLTLFIAKNPEISLQIDAPGCHLPEHRIAQAPMIRARFPALLLTAACHSERSLRRAAEFGCDAAFLSPVFSTTSHRGSPALGPVRAAMMKRRIALPVYALGGVTKSGWKQLAQFDFAGFGAISAFEQRGDAAIPLIPRR